MKKKKKILIFDLKLSFNTQKVKGGHMLYKKSIVFRAGNKVHKYCVNRYFYFD